MNVKKFIKENKMLTYIIIGIVVYVIFTNPSIIPLFSMDDLGTGTSYYIDYSTTTSGDGLTPNTAMKYVPTGLQPGDNVIFKRGVTYPAEIQLTSSGSSSNYITYTSIEDWYVNSPDDKAILGMNPSSYCIAGTGVDYIRISDLVFDDCGYYAVSLSSSNNPSLTGPVYEFYNNIVRNNGNGIAMTHGYIHDNDFINNYVFDGGGITT